MTLPASPDLLRRVAELERISAEQHNIIIRLLQREVTGPNVTKTAHGWHIPDASSLLQSDRFVIIRSADEDIEEAKAQEIVYTNDALMPGEVWKHIAAIGPEFNVYPVLTMGYGSFFIQGSSPKAYADGENLSGCIPFHCNSENVVWPVFKTYPHVIQVNPNVVTLGAGGV